MAHLGVVDEEELERVCSERETVLQGSFMVFHGFSWFLVGFHGFSRWFHGFS